MLSRFLVSLQKRSERATLKWLLTRMFICSRLIAGEPTKVIFRAYSKLDTADPKLEPNLQALSVLRQVDLNCHLWQQYVSTALLPLAGASVTVRREMVIFNSQSVSRIEGAANTLINRLTDCKSLLSLSVHELLTCFSSDCCLAFRDACETEEKRVQAAQ